jgi:hypothetical protein
MKYYCTQCGEPGIVPDLKQQIGDLNIIILQLKAKLKSEAKTKRKK